MAEAVRGGRTPKWLADLLAALRKMAAATKPGGRVVVLDYNHEKIRWEPDPPASMQAFYAAPALPLPALPSSGKSGDDEYARLDSLSNICYHCISI